MILKRVEIHKYKSIESNQVFEIDDKVTILVGMNESGKTAILESIAKTNHFQQDENFKFNLTHDYPRKEKKNISKGDKVPAAITMYYELTAHEIANINEDIGSKVFKNKEIEVTKKYDDMTLWGDIQTDKNKFIEKKLSDYGIYSEALLHKLSSIKSSEALNNLINEYKNENIQDHLRQLLPYFKNKYAFEEPLEEYIVRAHLESMIPKYLYYDEYYSLPSRISIEKLEQENLEEEDQKTAKALFDLADININELTNSDDFENFKAELEATEANITEEIFEYWSTNKNLDIEFDIEKKEKDDNGNRRIVEHILDIRVKNTNKRVSLPLKNRSKGFNWFFSFLVWFKKIQEDPQSQHILLLDEPGLNLHASAQNDLLDFIEDLCENYQIIYTTHSPFMIPSDKLKRVRTVHETDKGSVISESIQEKDPKTLFPLQAALGYDIAQNLFISKNNLLIEGPADLLYLQFFSSLFASSNRTCLRDDITLVPVGGLDKVTTFISLLRGSKLNIACLLDTFDDQKGKAKVEDLIKSKIIQSKRIKFFDEFIEGYEYADIEDLFEKNDYLNIFNKSHQEYENITIKELNQGENQIIKQINKFIGKKRFNHYRPAHRLISLGLDSNDFSKTTLDNFERVIINANQMFR